AATPSTPSRPTRPRHGGRPRTSISKACCTWSSSRCWSSTEPKIGSSHRHTPSASRERRSTQRSSSIPMAITFATTSPTSTGRCIVDLDPVERREPRHLREQSKGGADHEELQRRGALLGPAACQWLIGLDHELSHPALEVDILDDACDSAGCGRALGGPLGTHLRPHALDLVHLLAKI